MNSLSSVGGQPLAAYLSPFLVSKGVGGEELEQQDMTASWKVDSELILPQDQSQAGREGDSPFSGPGHLPGLGLGKSAPN